MAPGQAAHGSKLLPDQIEERLRGAFNRFAGAGLIVFALAAWASLLTWSIDDPTLTRAGAVPATNLLGVAGAALSDLFLRGIGLASALALLPVLVWGGVLLVRQRVPRWRGKLMLWVGGVLSLSGALAAVPLLQSWRIPHGFGGLAGDVIYAVTSGALSHLSAAHGMVLATLLLLVGGASALLASFGAGRDELAMIWYSDAWQRRGAAPRTTLQGLPPGPRTGAYPAAPGALRPADGPTLFDRASSLWCHRPGRPDPSRGQTQAPAAPFAQPRPIPSAPAFAYATTYHPGPHGPTAQQLTHGHPHPSGLPYPPTMPPAESRHDPRVAQDSHMDFAAGAALDMESRAMAARFAPSHFVPAAGPMRTPQLELPNIAPPLHQARGAPVAEPPAFALPTAATTKAPSRGLMAGWKGRASKRQTAAAYRGPAVSLLKRAAAPKPGPEYSQNVQRGVAKLLEDVLLDFGVKGQIQAVKPGPVVTLYELEPARGVKASRIVGLSDDIARSMSATSARVAGVPGRNVIGIELPNLRRETVYLRELLESDAYRSTACTLPIVLGKSIGGEPVVADLARMPHVLVAGTTGSGKSVGINAMILSLLYKLGPDQCRFLMIDPKMLELSVYNGIPHLLAPVITDPTKAVAALNWVVREMEERYKRMAQLAVRNIEVFNTRIRQAAEQGEELSRTVQTGFDPNTGAPVYETERMQLDAMPYIVVVVDEMADLMLTAGKDIEGAVQRLAQMARAAGIHIIMATQRPSVDVITGTIKANFPTRISFKVTSKIDSRTILGEQGAEQLLGAGDMLFSSGTGQITRVHGPFVADEEVEQIAAYLRTLGEPAYVDGIGEETPDTGEEESVSASEGEDIYDKAVAVVLRDQKASTSYIQRRLSIGYNRAASIMERMEKEGLVSAANSVGKRNILVA